MNKSQVRHTIETVGIIPSIRVASADDARFAADVVAGAGIPIVEIAMTVPDALTVIRDLAARHPHLVVGAGTIFDAGLVDRAVDAGARFVTSPGLDLGIVEAGLARSVLVMPGALTPTEVTAAWRAGADLVKVFPCAAMGGAAYIRALRGPLPDVPLVAAGGVNQQSAVGFVAAGVTAIGVGRELIPRKAIQHRDAHWITELVHRFMKMVRENRGRVRCGLIPA